MKSLLRFPASLFLAFLCGHSALYAQSATEWIADSKGCKAWNPNPKPNESITWSGTCNSGFVSGDGTLTWLLDGKPNGTNTGTFQDGKQTGSGASASPNGERYEGEYQNGRRHGIGVLNLANGQRYEGQFAEG